MFFKNSKINIFFIFVLLVLFISFLMAVVYKPSDDRDDKIAVLEKTIETDTAKSDEAERIIEDNKDVIAEAGRIVTKHVRSIDDSDHVTGDADALVKMIVYCDFKNSLCSDFLDTIDQIKNEFSDKVAIAFRHYYLKTQDYSEESAHATECAADQEKFWDMHDELYRNYAENVSSGQYTEIARKLSMNSTYFEKCMLERKYSKKIAAQIAEAEKFGILGTPSSFINGEKIPGNYSFENFVDSSGKRREGVKSIIERYLKGE